jgi:hypothetical protein
MNGESIFVNDIFVLFVHSFHIDLSATIKHIPLNHLLLLIMDETMRKKKKAKKKAKNEGKISVTLNWV